jgi:transcriptional regulator with XRE-family HTH domain
MPHLFGAKLRQLRTQHNLSQTALAQQLSLATHAHVSNLEAGRKTPSLDLVLEVAHLFGVTTDYLLRDSLAVEPPLPGTSPQRTTGKQYPRLFGAKLRHLRKTHGLTQLDLSQQLALAAHAHISLLERGHSEASLDMVLQIADIFGVTTDYLLWDEIGV